MDILDSIFSDPSWAQSNLRGSPAQGINKTDAAALAGRFGFACRVLDQLNGCNGHCHPLPIAGHWQVLPKPAKRQSELQGFVHLCFALLPLSLLSSIGAAALQWHW